MDQWSASGFNENLPATLLGISPTSKAIYLICIFLFLGILGSLPLIHVPVTVTGQGYIRPEMEKAEIVPPTSGVVEEVFVSEGMTLKESAPVLRIRTMEQAGSISAARDELKEVRLYIQDLEKLLDRPMQIPESNRFLQEFEIYTSRLNYLEILFTKADRECFRNQGLHEKKLISDKQYEDLCFEREKTRGDIERFRSESRGAWQAQYTESLRRKRELERRISRWQEEMYLTTVLAPVSGNLVDFQGVYPGSTIRAGEVIGIISPDSRLIGEFYLMPKDIAFVYPGQTVQLRMQSFPASEWGMPAGRIYEISDDFLLMDKQVAYRVKCRLEDTGVYLKNGTSGQLKKGMTFQAHCIVVHRSLLQLIRDKTDDWINPLSHAPA
jgi:HlyD family secretion protein